MNVENIKTLIDAIKHMKHGHLIGSTDNAKIIDGEFNMCVYSDSCGTPCCIAGHAAVLAGGKADDLSFAKQFLGVDEETFDSLCVPFDVGQYEQITPADAAKALEVILENPDASRLPASFIWAHVKKRLNEVQS